MKCELHNLVTVLLILSAPLYALAGVQISLTGLHGGYEIDPAVAPDLGFPATRVVPFTIPDDVESVDEMTLVISGEWHDGEISCTGWDGSVETSPLQAAPSVSIWLQYGYPSRYFHATIVVPSGEFTELSAPFESCCPPGSVAFDELIGAEYEAEMSVAVGFILDCWLSQDAYGTLTEVRIDLEGSVPVEQSTWSSVKGLYE